MRQLLILASVMLMAGCGQPESEETPIEEMEGLMRQQAEMDTALAFDLTAAYLSFAEQNPNDSMAPVYLSRAADIFKEIDGKELKAVNTYNKVLVEYKNHPLAARSVFMIGYVFDDKLKSKERAAKSYRYFVETYPDHELASDAKNLLALVEDTLTDEEVVAKWLKEAELNKDTNPKVD